jgi:hypothetical protein
MKAIGGAGAATLFFAIAGWVTVRMAARTMAAGIADSGT